MGFLFNYVTHQRSFSRTWRAQHNSELRFLTGEYCSDLLDFLCTVKETRRKCRKCELDHFMCLLNLIWLYKYDSENINLLH